jgi:hypothetical protein
MKLLFLILFIPLLLNAQSSATATVNISLFIVSPESERLLDTPLLLEIDTLEKTYECSNTYKTAISIPDNVKGNVYYKIRDYSGILTASKSLTFKNKDITLKSDENCTINIEYRK